MPSTSSSCAAASWWRSSIRSPSPITATATPPTRSRAPWPAGLKETVLLKTSKNSQLIEKIMAQFGGGEKDFKASDKEYALAIRLTGKFKTAFPDGKPGEKAGEKKNEGEKKDGDEKKAET